MFEGEIDMKSRVSREYAVSKGVLKYKIVKED